MMTCHIFTIDRTQIEPQLKGHQHQTNSTNINQKSTNQINVTECHSSISDRNSKTAIKQPHIQN